VIGCYVATQEQQLTTIVFILKRAGMCCDNLPEMDKIDPGI
jgi:hypothetical protein